MTYPLVAKNTVVDPGMVNDAYMFELGQNVVEGLVAYDEKNRIAPCLAERWEVSSDGRTYTFHLRPGVRFTNGRAFVADDVRKSWERYLAPQFGSPYSGTYLGAVDGVAAFQSGKAKTIRGLRVEDDATLKVTLDKPRPYFLGSLVPVQTGIIDVEAAGPSPTGDGKRVVGTGPFRYERVLPDHEVDLVANPQYWGGAPKIERIKRPIVQDASARINGFWAGEYDYVALLPVEAGGLSPERAKQGNLTSVPQASLTMVDFGPKAYRPFGDPRVRRAFALAFDRKRFVLGTLAGQAEATGLVPHGVPGRLEGYKGLAFDPKAARRELEAAGYPDGRGLPPVEIDYSDAAPEARQIAEALAGDLTQHLGVVARTKVLTWSAFLDRTNKGQIQMGVGGWMADYLDPQNFLGLQLASDSPINKRGLVDMEFDALMKQADVETRPELRTRLNREAERVAVENADRLPVYMAVSWSLRSNRLHGFRENAFGPMPLTKVEVVEP